MRFVMGILCSTYPEETAQCFRDHTWLRSFEFLPQWKQKVFRLGQNLRPTSCLCEQSTDIQGTQFKAAKEHMGGWIMAGWKNEQQHKLSQEISGEFSVWESIRPCLVVVFLLFLFPIAPGYCQDTVTPDAYAGKAQQWLPRIHLISFTPSFTALSHSLIDASPFFPPIAPRPCYSHPSP